MNDFNSAPSSSPPPIELSPRHRSRVVVSRALLIGWCAWLLASWVLNLAWEKPARAWVFDSDGAIVWRVPAEAFVSVIRGMLISMMVGIGLIWPLWRLSQDSHDHVGRETAVDLAALLLICQVVIWPLRALIDISISGLLLATGVISAWGCAIGIGLWLGRRLKYRSAPAIAMLWCFIVLFGGWAVASAVGKIGPAYWSPLYMLWSLCGKPTIPPQVLLRDLGVICLGTLIVWLLALALLNHRTSETSISSQKPM